MRPQASIIILTHNSERYVDRCLDSVLALDAPPSCELLVIDNASSDRTVALLERFGDRITLVRNRRNLLSTRGLNPGIRSARGAIVVLLDVDTEVRPGWLAALCRPIEEDPAVAVTGSKLLFPGGATIQHAGGSWRANFHPWHYGHGERDEGQWDEERDVDYVTGASTAIRRSFLEQMGGGLDELFPFYFEDVDLCHQARALGYRVVYVPSSVAIHHESVGLGVGTPRYLFNMHRGRCRSLLKNAPVRYLAKTAIPSELRWIRRDSSRADQLLPLLLAYLSLVPAVPRIARRRLSRRRLVRSGECGPVRACVMASSLFLRANGSLSCWCDNGKHLTLAELDGVDLGDGGVEVLQLPALRAIRRAFARQQVPHPGTCEGCVMYRNRVPTDRGDECRFVRVLHVEPSIVCRLRCLDCNQSLPHPPQLLSLPLFEALLENLRRGGVERVGVVHFEGLGEPLMNAQLPEMVARAHSAFPRSQVMLTTNGDGVWDGRFAGAPIHHLRVSIDGIDQRSYERYRRRGRFDRAYAFLAAAARNRAGTGWPRDIEWKYILFNWNDSDEEIGAAAAMARDLGVRCSFDMSFAADVTQRFTAATLDEKIAAIAPGAANVSRVRAGY